MRLRDENLILLGMLKSLSYLRWIMIKGEGSGGLIGDIMDQLETGVMHRLSKITYQEFKEYLVGHRILLKGVREGETYLSIPITKEIKEKLEALAKEQKTIEEYVAYKLLKEALTT